MGESLSTEMRTKSNLWAAKSLGGILHFTSSLATGKERKEPDVIMRSRDCTGSRILRRAYEVWAYTMQP